MKDAKRWLDSSICLYVCSWDFVCALIVTIGYILFLSHLYGGLPTNIMKDIFVNFGIYIPVLSIIVTIFVLTLTIIITALPEDFLLYLESHNEVFSKVKQYHTVGFYIYFAALFGNIALQVYIRQLLPANYDFPIFWYKAPFIIEALYCITVFFTLYSLFYALSLICHLSKLLDIRIRYIKKYKKDK